jgi:hypothetical protein
LPLHRIYFYLRGHAGRRYKHPEIRLLRFARNDNIQLSVFLFLLNFPAGRDSLAADVRVIDD